MKARTSLVKDIAFASLRHLAGAAAGLLTIPLVARALGADGLGAWALVGTASFVLAIADLGLSTAVQRAAAQGNMDKARHTVGLALTTILVVAPLLAIVGGFGLSELPTTSASLRHDLPLATALALLGGAIAAFAYPYRALLLVKGGVRPVARARTVGAVAQVAITAGVLAVWPSLVAPALALLVSSLLETALVIYAAKVLDPALPIGPARPPSLRAFGALLGEGGASLAVNVGGLLALRADIALLAGVSPLATVAAYGVASRVVDQSFTLAKQTSTALLPRLSDPKAREHAARLGTALLGGLVASGMASIVLLGDPALVAWAGPVAASPEVSIAVGLLGAASVIAAGHEVVASTLTLGAKSAWTAATPLVLGYAVNVVFSFVLVSSLGVWAVAGGTLLGNALTSVLLWSRAAHLLGWDLRAVVRTLAPVVAGGAAALGAGLLVGHTLGDGLASSLAGCAATTGLGLSATALLARRSA